ncbi:MAG TPA: hypothetical protein VM537_15985, partial [Anaerolineae bacterium]|nr:hypothetical protein [Anaerolineae bacterium]
NGEVWERVLEGKEANALAVGPDGSLVPSRQPVSNSMQADTRVRTKQTRERWCVLCRSFT